MTILCYLSSLSGYLKQHNRFAEASRVLEDYANVSSTSNNTILKFTFTRKKIRCCVKCELQAKVGDKFATFKAKQKYVCVSGYRTSLSLDHCLNVFIVVFGFLQLILLAEKCFQFQLCFRYYLY